MKDQHRATAEEWACVNEYKSEISFSCLIELRDRIKALEATQHAHVDMSHVINPEKEKMAQEFCQAAGFAPSRSESEGWHYIKDLYGKSVDSPPQPNHPEIPGGSLKERIKSRMIETVGSPWEVTTASVLTEVAAWFREQKGYNYLHSWAAITLEEEAER